MAEARLEPTWITRTLVKIALHLDDELIHVDRLNPTSAAARSRFLKTAKAKHPQINDEVLDAILMDLAEQGPHGDQDRLPGSPVRIESPEPAQHPVDGHELLADIEKLLTRHVVLPEHASTAISLWVLFTYAFESFDISPRLLISSPVHRCGKTRLLRLIAGLCNRAISVESISPSALFRTIEIARPTILIDEADAFMKGEDFRGLLNAGHARTGRVIRALGADAEPRSFSVWSALAISMIGKPPPTVVDRSIIIEMQRKAPGGHVARVCRAELDHQLAQLRRRCARWAEDALPAILAHLAPEIPETLNDRAADNWEPLLAIADQVGGAWSEAAREAAVALSAKAETDTEALGLLLLRDVRDIFDQLGAQKVASAELVTRLKAMSDRPWARSNDGPITATRMAKLLRPFGLRPGTIRLADGKTPKGYTREAFEEAWHRLLGRHNATSRARNELRPVHGDDEVEREAS